MPALARRRARADPPVPPGAPYPDVPTLVINGDLDNITASLGRARRRGPLPALDVRGDCEHVHISALGDRDGCAAPLVRRFIRTLDAGDTSCAGRIAEVRTRRPLPAPRGAVRLGAGTAAAAPPVAAVAAMVADAIQRWSINYSGASRGLRGGRWSYTGDAARPLPLPPRALRPRRAGQRHRDLAARRRRGRARLRLPGRGRLHARWNVRRQHARSRRSTARSAGGSCAPRCSRRSARRSV